MLQITLSVRHARDSLHVYTAQYIEILFTRYDIVMILVSWRQIIIPEFRDSPQTTVLKTDTPCWRQNLTNNPQQLGNGAR